MPITVFSSDAGCFGSGVVNSWHVDGISPQFLYGTVGIGDPYQLLVQFVLDWPQGVTIPGAKLRLYTNAGAGNAGTGSNAPSLRCVDLDDATWSTSYSTVGSRPLTSASTSGTDPLHLHGVTEWDVTTILQEIVDRPGFVSGNYVIIQNVTIYSDGYIEYLPNDADADFSKRPTLFIDDGTGGGGGGSGGQVGVNGSFFLMLMQRRRMLKNNGA